MKALRNVGTLSAVGLVILGLIALVLSGLALTRFRDQEASPASAPAESPVSSPSESPAPPSWSAAASSSPPTVSAPSPSTPAQSGPEVVLIGDSFSVGEEADLWVRTAAEELGWGRVTNLSSPGRGYLAAPDACGLETCANFAGSIGLIAELEPDVVVTFGGTADGDYSLADAAAEYFDELRRALPEAELVAISPVTTDESAPYFLTLHGRTIRAGAEAVGGTFVDVGQPGLGDGEELSATAHAAIAAQVIEQLR